MALPKTPSANGFLSPNIRQARSHLDSNIIRQAESHSDPNVVKMTCAPNNKFVTNTISGFKVYNSLDCMSGGKK